MKIICLSFITIIIFACSHNKNLAQSTVMPSTDSLIQYINSSKGDTEMINPKLKQLQQQNDLVISFGSLNYAWARRGSFYVLTRQKEAWKLYRFDTKLPPSVDDEAMNVSPLEVNASDAEQIKTLYTKAQLWNTEGDNGESFCSGKKNCNINDAETWTISVTTKENIHTTSYYAPEFFEECCPGDTYRKPFVAIAKAMIRLAPDASGGSDK